MLTLANGTTIPTEQTRGATFTPDGIVTLSDGRRFKPALLLMVEGACPRCEAEGRRTVGGYTPGLKQRSDDGFIGCITHDGQRLTGHMEVL